MKVDTHVPWTIPEYDNATCTEIGCDKRADLVLVDDAGVPFPLGTFYGRVAYLMVCEGHRLVAEERADQLGMRIDKPGGLRWRPWREVRR